MESKNDLTPEEQDVLTAVERAGAISPSRLSAQMQIAPPKMWEVLKHLEDLSRVILRDDPDSADGKLAIVNMAPQSKAE